MGKKQPIAIAVPEVRFPEAGFRERVLAWVSELEKTGLHLKVQLEKGASETDLAAFEASHGKLPRDLRTLLAALSGGRVGHLTLVPLRELAAATERLRYDAPETKGIPFARDLAGMPFAATDEGVALVAPDREHRFSSLGNFLTAALVHAHAAALHREAEARSGDDLDDEPWVREACAVEARIDPAVVRKNMGA